MPLNHHFSPDIPQPVWWGTQHPFMEPPPKTPSPTTTLIYPNSQFHRSSADPNSSFSGEELPVETADAEHMFEKPLTPSDVGKLNRLVIPKQHAEKYFPIGAGGGADSGLLLSFEDESGKFWKFRYSYWNSSQSYVLTKGWSRFVKEKRLDAGDVVVFGRDRTDGDRLFIGWRRRTVPAQPAAAGAGVNGGWSQVCYSAHPYPSHSNGGGGGAAMPIPYQPDCLHAGIVVQKQTSPTGNSKILRLFGVNLECQSDDGSEPSNHEGPSVPTQGQAAHHCTNDHTSYPQSYMEFNLSRDVNQMRYDLG